MKERERFQLLEHLRPMHLLTAVSLYLIGAGLAHYLGAIFEPSLFLLELGWMVLMLEGFFFLGDFLGSPFQLALLPIHPSWEESRPAQDPEREILLLYPALGLLSGAAVLTAVLVVNGLVPVAILALMAVFFLLLVVIVLPAVPLVGSGYSEFAASLCLVVIPPALGFVPQYGSLHRYLYLAVFPLFPLNLALLLTLQLRSYAEDLHAQRRTLLVRMGWRRGVFFHNMLVLSGFLLFGCAVLFGLPLRAAGPVFIALLPAGFLVWYYASLERGAPVRWPLIIALAAVIFGLPVYLLLFAFWIY